MCIRDSSYPEVTLEADRVVATVVRTDGPDDSGIASLAVPRDDDGWRALATWLSGLDGRLDGAEVATLVALPGVPYRDLIRAYETMDHAHLRIWLVWPRGAIEAARASSGAATHAPCGP